MSSRPGPALAEQTTIGSDKNRLAKRAAVASLVGTAVEWYDYFIFGTASALVFGTLFFPSSDPLMGTLSAFAVFGVGFFFRPLGGIVFGHIGDKVGRKGALVATLLIMGVSTFLIGLLPTTEQIGIWAPILLVVLRLLQGFGVGGEWGGASLVAVEYAPEGKRGAYGSFPQIGNAIGLVAATGVFALVTTLPQDQVLAWGWRVPFLISAVLIAVGLFIRFRLTETPAFVAAQEEIERKRAAGDVQVKERLPLVELMRRYWRPLLIAMGMRLGEGIWGYIMLSFVLVYATNYTQLPRTDVLLAGTISAAVGIGTFYWFGRLSDQIGRRKVFMIGAGIGVLMAFPLYWLLDLNSVPLLFAAVIAAYSFGVGAMYAVEPSFFSELFGTKVRYTGVSMAAQIPSMIVGAWPFAATALLIATHGNPWPVALLTILTVGGGFWCAWIAQETYRDDLTKAGEQRP